MKKSPPPPSWAVLPHLKEAPTDVRNERCFRLQDWRAQSDLIPRGKKLRPRKCPSIISEQKGTDLALGPKNKHRLPACLPAYLSAWFAKSTRKNSFYAADRCRPARCPTNKSSNRIVHLKIPLCGPIFREDTARIGSFHGPKVHLACCRRHSDASLEFVTWISCTRSNSLLQNHHVKI